MLPNLIIIGAVKSGTTSLHHYLGLHPDVSMSALKEPTFFVDEQVRGKGPSFLPGTWERGLAWYESLFAGAARVHGEASTMYTNFPLFPGVPARMRSVVPDVKLIYVLRDPIERAEADYRHLLVSGVERRSITAAFDQADNPYVWRSQYFLQLTQFLEHFSPSQILLITSEDLLARRSETINQVLQFLGLAPQDDPGYQDLKERHEDKRRLSATGQRLANWSEGPVMRALPLRGSRLSRTIGRWLSVAPVRPVLPAAHREMVAEWLSEDVARLRAFSGLELRHWSV